MWSNSSIFVPTVMAANLCFAAVYHQSKCETGLYFYHNDYYTITANTEYRVLPINFYFLS